MCSHFENAAHQFRDTVKSWLGMSAGSFRVKPADKQGTAAGYNTMHSKEFVDVLIWPLAETMHGFPPKIA